MVEGVVSLLLLVQITPVASRLLSGALKVVVKVPAKTGAKGRTSAGSKRPAPGAAGGHGGLVVMKS